MQTIQKQLSPVDLDAELMSFIHDYLVTVEHPCSFFVRARELLINEEVLPEEHCVLVALRKKTVSEFPATSAGHSAMVITTPDDQHFAALLLRDQAIALPDHAFASWNAPQPQHLLVVYQFADATILEKVPMTDALIENLSICAITAQSGDRPTYAELQADANDISWDSPLQILDNRHIRSKDTETGEASSE